ncbi:MAG: 1-deoxy-D-xylulose-5-phosphate synthase [bacterium]|nr:1-deoxy-D-xylulose-5-phosphate synthase [bacterium]
MEQGVLSRINGPDDLRSLDRSELSELANDIRHLIIDTVSRNGGHLAASLGVVELTIALHRVFHSPDDKIIWDVGHQCYAHKILTGRRDLFPRLRQYGGLSGFPKRAESIHDAFDTGHSSTSISAALGMCIARDMQGKHYKVIAVIGDGSLTGGMAFEAMNHAGDLKKDLLVILNDNKMSISPNVGALSTYLNRIISGQFYNRMKREIEMVLRSIPQIGTHMVKMAGRLDEAIKSLVVPGIMFEELGFKYIGPIPGHNLMTLIDTLEAVKRFQRPVVLHVLTQKGKGYTPAELKPSAYHSASPFIVESGSFKLQKDKGQPSYTQVFSQTLIKIAQQNSKIVGITAAMPEGTGLDRFAQVFPERFFDVGIAEQHAVTLAAGMACQGLRPVVSIYSTFLQRAYDQILHDVCLQNLPVIFAIDRAGLVGEDGPTHQGSFDLSYLRPMPNLILMAPKDENELQHMLYTATLYEGPVAIRYPRGNGLGVSLDETLSLLPIGRGEVVRRGEDLTLIAIGSMVSPAFTAAERLADEGIRAQVINARFVKPLDRELILQAARRTGRLITIEENVLPAGFGSAVLELLEQEGLWSSVRVRRCGIPEQFMAFGPRRALMEELGLSETGIVSVARQMCSLEESAVGCWKEPF